MSTSIPQAPAPTKADTGDAARIKKAEVKHRKFDPWGVVAWIVGLGFFFPVFWMVLTAFKQEVDAYTTTPKFLFVPTLDEFKAVFDQGVGTGLVRMQAFETPEYLGERLDKLGGWGRRC